MAISDDKAVKKKVPTTDATRPVEIFLIRFETEVTLQLGR